MQRLKVSGNKRYLVTEDGRPFFYLGDTAYGLFEHLKRDEVCFYLDHRASQGFNVILTYVLSLRGLIANAYGESPLIDGDANRPNPAYFEHVDYVVDQAEKRGLYVALGPCWGGSYVGTRPTFLFTPSNKPVAYAYGRYFGERYRDRHIVWVLGGCARATDVEDVYAAMAEGIADGLTGRDTYDGEADFDAALMTFHPDGWHSSSEWLHHAKWLDVNGIQSNHDVNNRCFAFVRTDYSRVPAKPTMDIEGQFEQNNHAETHHELKPHRLTAYDVRKVAYTGVFSGGAGFTYGHNDVFQFYTPNDARTPWGDNWDPAQMTPWQQALDHDGGRQMKFLRHLFETERSALLRVPEGGMTGGVWWGPGGHPEPRPHLVQMHWAMNRELSDFVSVLRASDGSYGYVYLTQGKPITIDLGRISGSTVRAYWYDPRTGQATFAGEHRSPRLQDFRPPTLGMGNDWVLVLDDASRGFADPGY